MSTQRFAYLPLLALALPLSLGAATFTYSHAPVADDAGPSRGASAQDWPHISLRQARRLLRNDGVVFVDGRTGEAWVSSHLADAVSLPTAEFASLFPALRSRLARARVLVCYGRNSGAADDVARLLAGQGLRTMAVFSGGLSEWKGAAYPLEGRDVAKQKNQPVPLPGMH